MQEQMQDMTPETFVRFDMRSPDWGTARHELYAAALDMAAFADERGFTGLSLAEHHGMEDGYCPSSITLAAAMAARTRRIELRLSAIVVPLHDPLRLAEELAVLDNLSNGRAALVAVGGYIQSEFEMFDKDFAKRGRAVEETIETLRAAWTGEPFVYRGRMVRVTPRPCNPHLPIYLGGASPVAARRAGRLADGFIVHDPDLHRIYMEEAARLGRKAKAENAVGGPAAIFVSEDPERTWHAIERHAIHEAESYAKWQEPLNLTSAYRQVATLEDIKTAGSFAVLTPDECVALGRQGIPLMFHPLVAGIDPQVGWETLQLVADRVLPHLR
jgi:alkanesulfonate monooxygenase SsuD/methylene tetrahydromethanopterin reductase-like flavin-dependent oxidoreductase (luciferase family)